TITLRRIKNATKNFRHDKNIGEGGSAHVFNGKFKKGQICAVKRLKPAAHRDTDYNNEVHLLSRLSHPNIINVVGCCADDDEEERIVVYEFMPLGTLYDQLHARKNGQAALDWDTRMRIAAGVAKGLSYLHNEADPQIIYRDLKPTNVLLGDGFHPRISDFGIAKSAPFDAQSSTVTTAVLMGTPPYWAPENALAEGHSFKSDVYSFGAVLLEIIVCDVPLDTSSGGAVAHWVTLLIFFILLLLLLLLLLFGN
ncbi:serine/threonine-protein kinase pbs1, partial [Phtheirospermum japonicum]